MSAETMKAMVLKGHGDFDMLEWRTDYPKPEVGPTDVLLEIGACGLNNTDVNTRTAWYSKGVDDATTGGGFDGAADDDATWGGAPLTFPRIQGADAVGRIVAMGAEVDPSLMGKRCLVDPWFRDWSDPMNMNKALYFGSERDGGYAEFVAADHRNVHPIESDRPDTELATFATSYVTAENMLDRAAVAEGDAVLIPGASGGVGSALIQLAKRRGAVTVAMCGEAKRAQVEAIGPDAVLGRAPEDLKGELERAIGKREVTVVADVVGGDYQPTLLDVLARGGRYTCAGAIAGPIVSFDLRTFYLRDLTLIGATIVPPGTFARLVGYIAREEIKPLLAEVYPLEKLVDAQRAFIEKRHVGNIVVTPS